MIVNAPVIQPVPGNSDIVPQVCSPWDDTTFEDIQSTAEDIVIKQLEQANDPDNPTVPRIISLVRDSFIPIEERIGYPAYTPLNFYDNLGDQYGPESFLDGLDFAGVRGELPRGRDGPKWTMWRLPGHGSERTKYQCGKFLTSKTYGCPEGHELHAVRCGCNRLDCPVCWTDKVRRNANNIRRRLNVVDQLYNGLKWYHVVVSPPQDRAKSQWSTEDGFKQSKKETLQILKKAGALGGVIVCHPYRQNDGTFEWRGGPHFHVLMNGRIDASKIRDAIDDGWVVANKGERPIEAMFYVAYYLCSHAGVGLGGVNKNGKQMSIKSVSYFGNCGTNNGNAPGKLREETHVSSMECSTCEIGLYRVREYFQMRAGWLDFISPVEVKRTTTAWCIRSDIDGLRASEVKYNGRKTSVLELDIGLLNLPEYLGSRVFVEYPEPDKELSLFDVGEIDAEMSIELRPKPSVGGLSSGRPRPDRGAVGVPGATEGPRAPYSPGPGGGNKRGSRGAVSDV